MPSFILTFSRRTFSALCIAIPLSSSAYAAPTQYQSLERDQLRGQVIYLDFWASWCGPCHQSFPFMEQLHQHYAAQGLKVIAVSVDENASDVASFLNQYNVNFDIAHDPNAELAQEFQLIGMPSSFILSPDGKEIWNHKGFKKSDQAAIEKAIQQALEKYHAQ